jgi:DNA primase
MRPAPRKNWVHFNAAKYAQYPASKERKLFNTTAPMIPYRLPELLAARAADQTIHIAEGEKKVDCIRDLGFAATCCAGGANKWRAEHTAFLQGADVVLLPDNDAAGREHVETIAENLAPVARRLRIL